MLTTTFDLGHDEMVLVKDIEVCSHLRAPPGAVPRRRARRLHPGRRRPDHRPVQAGPAGRRLRPPPAGAGAADHPDRRRADAHPRAARRRSSSSSASTCACRCAASASPVRGRSPPRSAASCATPPTRAEAMSLILGAVTRVRPPRSAGGASAACPRRRRLGRCLVMGVVNVTPDSFSDGGAWLDADARRRARARAGRRRRRPRRRRRRVDPAGRAAGRPRTRSCAGCSRSSAALAAAGRRGQHRHHARRASPRAALEAGARAGQRRQRRPRRPRHGRRGRRAGVPYVAMHWRGHSVDMDRPRRLRRRGRRRRRRAARAGWTRLERGRRRPRAGRARPRARLRQDAGAQLGAARAPGRLDALGRPLLVGASRKGFLGRLLADAGRRAAPGGRARRRDRRGLGAGRRARRLGGPGARGAGQPRRGRVVAAAGRGSSGERRRGRRPTRRRAARQRRVLRRLRDGRPRPDGGACGSTVPTPTT